MGGLFVRHERPQLTGVEAQLEKSRLQNLLVLKVLLLGAGECGKSTVLRQIRLVHKIGFTEHELRDFGVNLRSNTVQSMQTLVEACSTVTPPVPLEGEELKAHAEKMLKFEFADDLCMIPPDMVETIQYLWSHKSIRDVWDRRTEFWCLDSIDYYFENVERFCEPDFDPDEQDCVMARIITTGIVTTEFDSAPVTFQMIDVGGQRNERRKWIHCFDDVTAIVYIVNLSGYATVLYEDSSVNRMWETLEIFKTTLNSEAFSKTPIYLVLNKKDLLEQMLRKKPLTDCFPEYAGPQEDVVAAIDFFTSKFREQLLENRDRMKSHAIAARFKRDVRTVWEDIANDLKHIHAKDIAEATKGLAKMAQAEGQLDNANGAERTKKERKGYIMPRKAPKSKLAGIMSKVKGAALDQTAATKTDVDKQCKKSGAAGNNTQPKEVQA